MSNLDWLRERETKILARISQEDSPTSRIPAKPADRRARRDALMVIRRRIEELEALEGKAPSVRYVAQNQGRE